LGSLADTLRDLLVGSLRYSDGYVAKTIIAAGTRVGVPAKTN